MKRESVNNVEWGVPLMMDQAEIVQGATRTLRFSGQCSLRDDPNGPFGIGIDNPGDTRAQMQSALANIDAILTKANMTRKNLVHLRFFTTDIDGCLENYDVYADWIGAAGIRPPQSMIGVQRLVFPELKIEIEATAAA